MIVIVNYGLGNLRSVQKAFERIRVKAAVSDDPEIISGASKLILPGVGNFSTGMKKLEEKNMRDLLTEKVISQKTPILGICLGMQLMTDFSEEGNCRGLGWIRAQTRKFRFNAESHELRIPHMGWNTLQLQSSPEILSGITEDSLLYFVHSYHVCCENPQDVIATTHYGYDFHSAFRSENIFGFQFHPEKSHKTGLALLKKFSEI